MGKVIVLTVSGFMYVVCQEGFRSSNEADLFSRGDESGSIRLFQILYTCSRKPGWLLQVGNMFSSLSKSCKWFLCFCGDKCQRPESPYEMDVLEQQEPDQRSSTPVHLNETGVQPVRPSGLMLIGMASLESNISNRTDSPDMETEQETLDTSIVYKPSLESVISNENEANDSSDEPVESDSEEMQLTVKEELPSKFYEIEHIIPEESVGGESSDIFLVIPMVNRRRASVPLVSPTQIYH